MFLTISTTHQPATDLGYLLHKHPDRFQTFTLPFGEAHLLYPEAGTGRCTVALIVEVDPIGLVRGRDGAAGGGLLTQYVNDRPYAASSLLSVAMSRVFSSAMSGKCEARPDLPAQQIPLAARVVPIAASSGADTAHRLFEPLGYRVVAAPVCGRDGQASAYLDLTISGEVRLANLLSHLYVLIPVLDGAKHYWVGEDEVEKLLKQGEGWLPKHPERETITWRYLKGRGKLAREALARLAELDDAAPDDADEDAGQSVAIEAQPRLHELRLARAAEILEESGATTVLDLGCGHGSLITLLLRNRQFQRIVGVDVSARELERASERLHLERRAHGKSARVQLIQGALTYSDTRLQGFDAAAVMEVIEHIEPARLEAFSRAVFQVAHPRLVVLSTPNRDYNPLFPTLTTGEFRHADHRFEWSRSEFQAWAGSAASRFKYTVRYEGVGEADESAGSPTQMAVFTCS